MPRTHVVWECGQHRWVNTLCGLDYYNRLFTIQRADRATCKNCIRVAAAYPGGMRQWRREN